MEMRVMKKFLLQNVKNKTLHRLCLKSRGVLQ